MFIVVLLCIVNIILAGIVLCKMFAKSGTPEIDLPALKEQLSGLNADEFARNREELNKNFASFRQENLSQSASIR